MESIVYFDGQSNDRMKVGGEFEGSHLVFNGVVETMAESIDQRGGVPATATPLGCETRWCNQPPGVSPDAAPGALRVLVKRSREL